MQSQAIICLKSIAIISLVESVSKLILNLLILTMTLLFADNWDETFFLQELELFLVGGGGGGGSAMMFSDSKHCDF